MDEDNLFKIVYKKIVPHNRFCYSLTYFNDLNLSSISDKYNKVRDILFTFMISEPDKNEFIEIFFKCQKAYFGFLKLKHIIDIKKSNICTSEYDLSMSNKLSSLKNHSIIDIYENYTIYKFKTSDIINIINKSLSNHERFFLNPHVIKNPYTNTPFTASSIYHIYFFLNESPYNMPMLFDMFIKSRLNIVDYIFKNEHFINEYLMDNHINTLNDNEIYKEIKKMIKLKNKSLKINITIDDEFPRHILIDAFKIFYKYHYISMYSFNEHKRFVHFFKLNKKLIAFNKKCKLFGRKYITSIKIFDKIKRNTAFRDNFVRFNDLCSENLSRSEVKLARSGFTNLFRDYSLLHNDDDDDDDDTMSDDDWDVDGVLEVDPETIHYRLPSSSWISP